MADNKVLTGAIAIIKMRGQAIGKMKDVSINETIGRIDVSKGLGSIFSDEFAVIKWSGTVSCSFWEVNYETSGVTDAIERVFGSNILSQIASGNNQENFEDQLVLNDLGVDIDVFKKLADVIDPNTKLIKPKAIPYATVRGMFIESDNVSINEGNVAGRNQSFKYLYPVTKSA